MVDLPLFSYTRPYNGNPPFQSHSDTSRAASQAMRGKLSKLHSRILEALEYHVFPVGMTDEEMCNYLDLPGNTLRPRRRELQLMNYLTDTSKRRKTRSGRQAIVWGLV